jgi:hypothetical protein
MSGSRTRHHVEPAQWGAANWRRRLLLLPNPVGRSRHRLRWEAAYRFAVAGLLRHAPAPQAAAARAAAAYGNSFAGILRHNYVESLWLPAGQTADRLEGVPPDTPFDRPAHAAWVRENWLAPNWFKSLYALEPFGRGLLRQWVWHIAESVGWPVSVSRLWFDAAGDVLAECFGHPWREALDPAWATGDVLALLRPAWDARNWGMLPIVADALEDAGCLRADVLDHLRGPGPHSPGCWAAADVLQMAPRNS